eukprot:Em0020g1059a
MTDVQLTIHVDYGGAKKYFTFSKRLTVQEALQTIGKEYKQPIDSIYLLYQSLELAENSSLGDVFPSDRVELAYLVKKDAKTPPRQGRTAIDLTKRYYGYCKTCKACVTARPVFYHCREQDGKFRLKRPEPVDLCLADVPQEQLAGECLVCTAFDATAKVTFQCDQEGGKVAFLKLVRCNSAQNVAYMMCQDVKEIIFVFPCQSRHSLCLDCFSSFCKVALGSGRFSAYDCGFSVCCPGPDESCSYSPVEDPHHFQMVDKEGVFGSNVMCIKCLNEITISSATAPQAPPPVQVPGREYSLTRQVTKLFTKQVTAPVSQRSKVTCPKPDYGIESEVLAFPLSLLCLVRTLGVRGNYLTSPVVSCEDPRSSLSEFDDSIHHCFTECLALNLSPQSSGWKQACLSLSRGGLGLRSVAVHSMAAYLGSVSSSSPDLASSHYVIDALNLFNLQVLLRILYLFRCQRSLIFSMICHNELRIANSMHCITLAVWLIGLAYSQFHRHMPPHGFRWSPPLGKAATWLQAKCSGASNGGLVYL